jgi:putative DNA primase/helicase
MRQVSKAKRSNGNRVLAPTFQSVVPIRATAHPKLGMKKKTKPQDHQRTDAGNAEMFAAQYGEVVRYDHRQGRWMIWDTRHRRWVQDTQGKVRILAIKVARLRLGAAANISDESKRKEQVKWALQSEDRHRLDATLELAKSLPPISDDGKGWDANPMLFGVPNGIVDLLTGKLREATQEDRITKLSPVVFDPSAKCPRFEEFLSQIFNGDQELIRFVQKAVGYSLTGDVSEQCVFCCYGSGANGKSTLFGVLHHISGLGTYAANLPFSALELQTRNGNDLVMLVGARFVTAAETNEGARLNEQRIKMLTGGDAITARALYKNSFTFLPTHKLWLAFNHKPIIADDSEGMWRRVRLIPFPRQFKPEEQDKNLMDALKAEAPGILAWAVRGCLLWRKGGLGLPLAVADATAAYQSESDNLGQFLEECCALDPSASVSVAELNRAYQQWTIENEERPLPNRAFSERMQKRGLRKGRKGHQGTHVWEGLHLVADMLTSADSVSDNYPHKETIEEIYRNPVSARQRVSSVRSRSNAEPDAVDLLFQN